MPVNHASILAALNLLEGGDVVGHAQIARKGPAIITARLSQTVKHDTYDGITVTITTLTSGEIHRNHFPFSYYCTLPEQENDRITPYNHAELTANGELLLPGDLRHAVSTYVRHFADVSDS